MFAHYVLIVASFRLFLVGLSSTIEVLMLHAVRPPNSQTLQYSETLVFTLVNLALPVCG
jgi:hypothetical protein